MLQVTKPSKDAATQLAEALGSNEGSRIFRLMKHLIYAQAGISDPLSGPPRLLDISGKPSRIGIWEHELRDGEPWYVRSARTGERAGLWANVRLIPPKRNGRRVVLLGESVARGYFFDPHFNPAMVLQEMLRKGAGPRDVDVVDLASTAILQRPLLELASAATDLRPDAVVVLAGNNWWRPAVNLNFSRFQEMSRILRSSGSWADVKAYQERLLRELTHVALDTLRQLAREHRFDLIIVVPEFNLVDWRTTANDPLLLTTAQTVEWRWLRQEGEEALAQGDLEKAKLCGERMLALDQGTTPEGAKTLAQVSLLAGDRTAARRYYEMARDSAICWPYPGSPRCYSVIQQVLRQEAAKGCFTLVDLSGAFEDHWRSGLPDRRMFLDYCHFTVDAAHAAMAAVARPLLLSLFDVHCSSDDLSAVKVPVNSKFEAEGHFLAAIHNANWAQDAGIVRYHCARAMELSQDINRMMKLFLDFHVRRAPVSLCKAFEELCQLQNISAISLLFNPLYPVEPKFLNQMLINEIVTALESTHPDIKMQNDALLTREHGVHRHDLELLDSAYSVASFLVPFDQPVSAYYKATDRTSSFSLICEIVEPVSLTITYRCRQQASEGEVVARVRNTCVSTMAASRSWTTVNFRVPADVLRSGVNKIEIQWPMPEWNVAAWKDQVAERLEGGQFPDVTPVYGEIYRLHASRVLRRDPVPAGI